MTATIAVQNEIDRFLKSTTPEVLCIVGEWGVGKTYNWQNSIDRLRRERSVGLSRYSYVSLFGINSLDGLKSSIFENLEFLVPEGASSMARLITNAKQYTDVVSAAPIMGNAVSKLQPHLFSAVRSQIVCIDDLERSGKGLEVRDVLGLISFLREQRNCKIVLLLNESQLEDRGANEFDDYFEKVIDTKVTFAPTAVEAVGIAIKDGDDTSKLISEYCIKLGVSNIRVIKKIERLVQLVVPLVAEFDPAITRQVVHSIVMFGWCKFDAGARPPPLDYLKVSSLSRYVDRKQGQQPSKDEARWGEIISRYEFSNLDDFDNVLLEFVNLGVLDADEIARSARQQDELHVRQLKAGSFGSAWRIFHDSFEENEEAVCQSLMNGITSNLDVVSMADVDGVLTVFKGLDRKDLVDALIDFVLKNGSKSFWLTDDFFHRGPQDQALKDIAAEQREAAKPGLDFEADLVASAETLNVEKLSQLAQIPVQQYRDLFASRTGDQMRRLILSALREAIKSGHIRPFYSETLVTLEGVQTWQRRDILSKTRVVSSFSSTSEHEIKITVGVEHPRPPLHPTHAKMIENIEAIGMRALRSPTRIGGVRANSSQVTFFEPHASVHDLAKCMDRVNALATEINRRGVGQSAAVALGLKFLSPEEIAKPTLWYEGLKHAAVKDVRRVIAEWADADSVAAHYGYGIDLFCTDDRGLGGSSVLDDTNRSWLQRDYGIKFMSIAELAGRLG